MACFVRRGPKVEGQPAHGLQISLIVFCLLLVAVTRSAADDVVRITNGEWPPFTSERFEHAGVLSRLVSEAFALEGIRVHYGFFPWKRAYEYARSGKFDGSVGWAPTPEHLRSFIMSEPIITVNKALFHLKSTPFSWSTLEDLRLWRVGCTAGYSYGPDWDQAVKEGRLRPEAVTLDEQSIRKLLAKRVDVIAMETDVANYLTRTLLASEEASSITHHPKLLVRTPICLALSRHSSRGPALLERFNLGLERLRSSGRYQELLEELNRGDCPPQ